MHAKKGITNGKRKLEIGKKETIKEMTAIRLEHIVIKAMFSFTLSFCLNIFISNILLQLVFLNTF